MPRFQEEHSTVLKRVMLPRLPGCFFTPEDIGIVLKETGLDIAQIEQWAKNFRIRLPRVEDKEAFLRASGGQETVSHIFTL